MDEISTEEPIPTPEPAILVRGVSKQYDDDPKVLNDMDMTVLKGTIYGLLGASGCGKTTLLGAIVGCRKIQSGSISILGKAPGVVPVKSIGYMPQDLALVEEFTIKNVLQHQGWIFGMTDEEIEERHKFYENLLDLPPANRLVKNLSGGQKRRLSLAVVLVQDPELLILDEPTVGLDPVLRQNLWDYLIKMTKEQNKTVVITTHYIEEARQANRVGMLRNGKMLAEGEPQALLEEYNCDSLETLFVSLSSKQEEINCVHQQRRLIPEVEELKILSQEAPKKTLMEKIKFTNKGHAKALMSKNFIRYVRHPGTLIITVLFPLIQVCTVFTAVGNVPKDLKIGIVNQELGKYSNCSDYIRDNHTIGGLMVEENMTCVFNGLGCKFAEELNSFIHDQVYFETLDEALQAVKQGKLHQVLFFPHNFSQASFVIDEEFQEAPKHELNFRQITVYRDEEDFALGLWVRKELIDTYFRYAEGMATDCDRDPRSAMLPIMFDEPVYGKANISFLDSIAPGTLALVLLGIPKALAIHTITLERTGGVWERTIVAGIKPLEIVISHMVTLALISAFQVVEAVLTAVLLFAFQCKGSILTMTFLLYLQSLIGAVIGIFLSIISKKEIQAIYCALGMNFSFFMLSGCLWPIEGMPEFLQYLSHILPVTIPIKSLNNIVFKGWDISNFYVYHGFLITSGYIVFVAGLCLFAIKFEKK